MLRFASFRMRNSTSVENLAKNLDLEDIRDILNQRKRNGCSYFGSIRYSSSSEFSHTIDVITKALPHTNASAGKIKFWRVPATSFWHCNPFYYNQSR